MFICFICKNNFPSVPSLLLHLKIQHKFDNNSFYRCCQKNCARDFSTIKSFKNHLKSKHLFDGTKNVASGYTTTDECSQENFTSDLSSSINSTENNDYVPLNLSIAETFIEILNTNCMSFLSRLYNSTLIPEKYIQHIIDLISDFLRGGFISVLKKNVLDILKAHHAEEKQISEIDCMFENLINPFSEYKTEYLRKKKFENDKLFVKPVEYVIGERQKQVIDVNGEVSISFQNVTGQFIPLHILFTQLFQINNVYNDMLLHINQLRDNKLVRNIFQSYHFRTIIRHFEIDSNKLVLPLLMYYDEFECGNPLGSHSGKQKLGAVYVSLPTFPPTHSSLLENIFLALLFHGNDRKEFGNKAVFKILIEFMLLEKTGITFTLEGHGSVEIRFILTLILGDNLGLHSLLGFVESFNSQFNCRFCKIDKSVSKVQVKENLLLLRTVENYQNDLAQNDLSKTGIKESCIFNTLGYIHAVQNYYVDIMHDLYEGVCHYDMIHILKHILIYAKYMSLDTLNNRLQSFNFSSLSNKPPKLRADFHLKTKISMSASEMLGFVRNFGLIVGDLIPKDDEIWMFYKVLRTLIDLVHSVYIDNSVLFKLQLYVEQHNDLYQKLFHDTLKPKHHHLLHYPRIMSRIGPVKYLSCMRYESKHKQSKMTANVSCSRVNISKTIATRHQLKLCYRFFNKSGFTDRRTVGPEILHDGIDYFKKYSKLIPPVFSDSFITKYISFGNIKYKRETLILIEMKENCLPIYGKIELIFVNSSKEIGFLYKEIKVSHFDEHIYAYKVLDTTINDYDFNFVNFCDLYEEHDAVMHRMPDGKLFINSKNMYFN